MFWEQRQEHSNYPILILNKNGRTVILWIVTKILVKQRLDLSL